MQENLLCFGFLCKQRDIPVESRKIFKAKDYSYLDKRIYEYIESAIDCAQRNHFDIFVYENDERVTVHFYLTQCLLFSKSKDALSNLIMDADDLFIFEDKDKVTFLEIRLCVEKRVNNS